MVTRTPISEPATKKKQPDLRVGPVSLVKVNWTILNHYLVKADLPTDGTDPQKVARLTKFFSETPKARQAACDNCGGVSDIEFSEVCPFCGEGQEEEDDDVGSDPPEASAAAKEEALKEIPKAQAPLALLGVPPKIDMLGAIRTEQDVDEAVREALSLKSRAAGNLWELGVILQRLYDHKAHRLRVVGKGKSATPKYENWNGFVEAEIGVTGSYSYKLMEVARKFSREQVALVGPAKLHVTLHIPEEERKRIVEAAMQGASLREVKAAVEEVKGRAVEVEPEPSAPPEPKKASLPPPKKKGKGKQPKPKAPLIPTTTKVTVAMLTKRAELPVQSNGKPVKNPFRGAPLEVVEHLMNGVDQRILLTSDDAGNLLVIVERIRV